MACVQRGIDDAVNIELNCVNLSECGMCSSMALIIVAIAKTAAIITIDSSCSPCALAGTMQWVGVVRGAGVGTDA